MVSLIWLRRNKVRLEVDAIPISRISSMASDVLQEFHQLHPTYTKLPRIARVVKWHPPPSSLLKVNFDGALFVGENRAGLGVIIRNDSGLVMAALL